MTIAGVGGVGKTHLATALAWQQTEADSPFADGVYFVPAVHLRLTEELIEATASIVGAPQSAREKPAQSLLNFLRDKRMLLVFDNFEQLLTAATWVAELVAENGTSGGRRHVAGATAGCGRNGVPAPRACAR